ncbi:hypothetical protein [Actinomadura sp. 3N407]|uniref:hypothetical protein n=1 Tax=Actinomadura sp. 3N407 TaxID=3457423 RepID=UPI003FCD98C1
MPDLGVSTKRLVLATAPGLSGAEFIAGGPVMNDSSVISTGRLLQDLGCTLVGTARQYSRANLRAAKTASSTGPAPAPIPPDVAAHVLHYYNAGGLATDAFTTNLIMAIVSADSLSKQRLALVFGEYVAAIDLVNSSEDGIAQLAALAATPVPNTAGAAR